MLTEQRLDKLATNVVDRYFAEKVALTDGVVDAARDQNLNPEQVRRLVESVNNMAFLRKFNNPEDTAHRMVDFETADPGSALSRLLDAAKDLMSGATMHSPGAADAEGVEDLSADLPNTRSDAPEAIEPDEPQPVGEPKLRGTVVIMKLRKTAEVLRDQQYQHRIDLTENFQKLATAFTRLGGPSFERFEVDAFYKWGSEAAPFLQLLRQSLNKPPAHYDHAALTKVARVIDTRTAEMDLLRKVMASSAAIRQTDAAMAKTAGYLAQLEQR